MGFIVSKVLEKVQDEDPEADDSDESDSDDEKPSGHKNKDTLANLEEADLMNPEDSLKVGADALKEIGKSLKKKKHKKARKGWAPPLDSVMSDYPSLSEEDLNKRFHACIHPTLAKEVKTHDLGSCLMDTMTCGVV